MTMKLYRVHSQILGPSYDAPEIEYYHADSIAALLSHLKSNCAVDWTVDMPGLATLMSDNGVITHKSDKLWLQITPVTDITVENIKCNMIYCISVS